MRSHPGQRIEAPSKLLLLSEGRALLELGLGFAALPALLSAQRGDGHSVLVLPGFLASDRSTEPLRRYLKLIGYEAYGWELGPNHVGTNFLRQRLRDRLAAICARAGRKVSLIGWSLGGIYARDLAIALPDKVRYVITLGSPISPSETNASGMYRRMSGRSAGAPSVDVDDPQRAENARLSTSELPLADVSPLAGVLSLLPEVVRRSRGELGRAFGLLKHLFEMLATAGNADRHASALAEATRDARAAIENVDAAADRLLGRGDARRPECAAGRDAQRRRARNEPARARSGPRAARRGARLCDRFWGAGLCDRGRLRRTRAGAWRR